MQLNLTELANIAQVMEKAVSILATNKTTTTRTHLG